MQNYGVKINVYLKIEKRKFIKLIWIYAYATSNICQITCVCINKRLSWVTCSHFKLMKITNFLSSQILLAYHLTLMHLTIPFKYIIKSSLISRNAARGEKKKSLFKSEIICLSWIKVQLVSEFIELFMVVFKLNKISFKRCKNFSLNQTKCLFNNIYLNRTKFYLNRCEFYSIKFIWIE